MVILYFNTKSLLTSWHGQNLAIMFSGMIWESAEGHFEIWRLHLINVTNVFIGPTVWINLRHMCVCVCGPGKLCYDANIFVWSPLERIDHSKW